MNSATREILSITLYFLIAVSAFYCGFLCGKKNPNAKVGKVVTLICVAVCLGLMILGISIQR